MKKIFQILIIVCGGLLMNSCYYDSVADEIIVDPLPDDPEDPDYVEILFGTDIQPIFTTKCAMCHNASRNPDLRVGNSYAAIVPEYVVAGDANNSPLYNKISTGHNTPSTDQLALIKAWIDRGAKND